MASGTVPVADGEALESATVSAMLDEHARLRSLLEDAIAATPTSDEDYWVGIGIDEVVMHGDSARCECPPIPARRLAQDETIGVDDLCRKLAVGNDPTSQPESGSRLMMQILGMAVRRKGDYHPLFRVAAQHGVYRANQIAVCGNHNGSVKGVQHRVMEQCHSGVYVGHFLFKSCATAPAGSGLGQVVPVLDGQVGQRFQRLQVGILALGLVVVVATELESSTEVPDGNQTLARAQQAFRQPT